MYMSSWLFFTVTGTILGFGILFPSNMIKGVDARTEQLSDSSNNNLMISMIAPDNWNSGVISQTVASVNWRLNALDATNDDTSAFFVVANLPSVVNLLLPLGQKSGILSMLLSQYATVNGESDITMSDGSAAHRYSISISSEQLHKIKAPIDKGYDAVLITTKQQSVTYAIIYASELGKMSQFESKFQNILNSVKFGSVSLSTSTSPVPSPTTNEPDLGQPPTDTQQKIVQTPSGPRVYIDPSCGPASPGFNVVVNANGFRPNSNVNWKVIDSHQGIPLYGYFKTNSTGGFSDVTFMDDLQPDSYKLALGTDDNNDNKFDVGQLIQFVNITIPCP